MNNLPKISITLWSLPKVSVVFKFNEPRICVDAGSNINVTHQKLHFLNVGIPDLIIIYLVITSYLSKTPLCMCHLLTSDIHKKFQDHFQNFRLEILAEVHFLFFWIYLWNG